MGMILPISLSAAAAALILNSWLAIRCGQLRAKRNISIGDGGDRLLTARMRAHANFHENTPLFLILLALVEFARGSHWILAIVAGIFMLARVAHGLGMDRIEGPSSPLRGIGTGVTMLSGIGLAIYAAIIPYLGTSVVTIGG
jgi:uncharacterized protein